MAIEQKALRTRQELTQMAEENPLRMTYSIGSDIIRVPRDQAIADLHLAVKSFLGQLESDPELQLNTIKALNFTMDNIAKDTAAKLLLSNSGDKE